jgi:pilus assembly protein Flp/PilA
LLPFCPHSEEEDPEHQEKEEAMFIATAQSTPLPARTPAPRTARLLRDQRGASLIEYVLLVGVVALLAVAGFKIFGKAVNDKISDQAKAVGTVNGTIAP